MTAHIHAIGTAVPDHDVHRLFIDWAAVRLEGRDRALFLRMAGRAGIEHRYSVVPRDPIETGGFYGGGRMPPTSERMRAYAREAPELALAAITDLGERAAIDGITHLVVASCTGFVAPGIDQIIARRLGLDGSVERTLVGFMGCYAAVAALRVAHHIARSDPQARILVVTVELCSLHMQDRPQLESLLAQLQFADGAAAALVSSEPGGIAIDRFFAATLPDSADLIRWDIGDEGFVMHLSGEVPGRIAQALDTPDLRRAILGNRTAEEIPSWAVHAGGRSILDAVEHGLGLGADALAASREVLRRHGNMSSSTLLFALAALMAGPSAIDGIAVAFGPGLAAEGFAIASL
ncbi:type III polyketide synthase [Rhizorhabdus dicambivorans]|uniref:Type III polyketide synthase n=1 Tax=Rhizorhabdus dicambivorans TaxID=1850238 RepID=A0A2A4FXE6_9SPHN|nr:type III polyketide synthase [Rhizorhabdus dicambivorans]ATE66002.1 type III polyketide synthase [Rhizorhabdus dicambivorans]PCE43119.1 type III polyketide synthase [Rhizorhabdus dicambivorans]